MKPEDQNRFKEIMVGLGDYYKEKITKTLMMVYWEDFSDCGIDDFARAVSSHRKDPDQGMFFPKTANLIKQLHGTGKQQARSIESKAELAWSEIVAHLQYHGPYKTFTSKDGVSLAAFHAVGGISKLSTADYDAIVWIKKEFISMYATYENTPLENLPKNIMGLEDLHRHKLEQKGQLTDILSIATDMIQAEAEKENEGTPKENFETGKKNLSGLKAIFGKDDKPDEGEALESIVTNPKTDSGGGVVNIGADTEKEKERRRAALEAAKANLVKGGDL